MSTTPPRFIMIGGFLGAGKTTTVSRLAKHYQDQGLRVAIVTNDQAADLVDTNSLRSQGFDVGEVAGACFCCNFNELTSVVEKLGADGRPDVILAEPVGSCTDLVATVIRPLAQVYQQPLDVAPYGVILKPSHGQRILRSKPQARTGFSPQAEYIFRKQIEEADFVIINRVDELPEEDVQELAERLADEYPGRPVLRMSARTGTGFGALCEVLEQRGDFGQRVIELDYDVYAAGEAELGWLNAQLRVTAESPFVLDDLLLDLIRELQQSLAAVGAETAHLKTIGLAEGAYGVANLVSSFTPPELSIASQCRVTDAQVVVNARVAVDPAELEQFVRATVDQVCGRYGASAQMNSVQSFRPGRPVPTHRISN
jgi:Ni2+-binding GTPase involved in maturation of urease and hydrogenase